MKSTDEPKLNEQQTEAVTHDDGPLLIIAGAGTGKTTVITERVKRLILNGMAGPTEILALTFTEKASREMQERVDVAMPYGYADLWISTFHAFSDRILRNDALHIGLDPAYRIMTEAESILFLRRHIFDLQLQYFRPLGNPTKFIVGLLQHFSRMKDEDLTPEQYRKWVNNTYPPSGSGSVSVTGDTSRLIDERTHIDLDAQKYHELARAYQMYEALKVNEGVMDYSDLIANTLQLFRRRPHVLKRYQQMFKYVLIDEFQDTNFAQNELAVMLAGDRRNITVVGDDDQAIYRWRGAAVSNIIQFREKFPDAKTIVLTENYRSTTAILESSYRMIQHNNPDRLEVKAGVDKRLRSARRRPGDPVRYFFSNRVEQEAERVAETIERLVSRGTKSRGKAIQYRDVAILVRANSHAEPFVRALSRADIPFQFLGPGQLFRQGEVKDLICYLKVLQNFEDNVSMFRVLSMDIFSLLPRDIAAVLNAAKRETMSVFEACERVEKLAVSEHTKSGIRTIVDMIHRHLGLVKHETAGQILYFFLEETGMLRRMTDTGTASDEQVSKNIAKFFDKLKTYEAEHDDASVATVSDWIDMSLNLGESPLASDSDWVGMNAVNILTVHSAKGLEFPVVFLVNLVTGRFPTRERSEQIPIHEDLIKEVLPEGDAHLEEERRLFYVGMTRAMDYLYLTNAQYYGEGKRVLKESPFIAEAIGYDAVTKEKDQQKPTAVQLSFSDWEKNGKKESVPHPVTEGERNLSDTGGDLRTPITYLSYSQIASFKTCPLQYKYRYIMAVPVPPSAALTFGTVIHAVLRDFYSRVKSGSSATEGLLTELLDTHWSSVGYGSKEYEQKMKDRGIQLLQSFYRTGFDPASLPTDMERSFAIRLLPTLKLGGRIDRIDLKPDGTVEIVDYKTGQSPKGRDVRNDLQLSVYAMAAVDRGLYRKLPEQVSVSFYYLEDNSKVTATRSEVELQQAAQDIISTAENMRASAFTPTPGKHCDFCEFRLLCEAWR